MKRAHRSAEEDGSENEEEEERSRRRSAQAHDPWVGGSEDEDGEDDLEFTTRYKRPPEERRRQGDHKPIAFVRRELALGGDASDDDGEEEEEEEEAPQPRRSGLGSSHRSRRTGGVAASGGGLEATYGIGSKLLKAMGWREGQGLGRTGGGIAEPIEVKVRPKNRGLAFCFEEKTEQQRRGGALATSAAPRPASTAAAAAEEGSAGGRPRSADPNAEALKELRALLPAEERQWRKGRARRGKRPQDAIEISDEEEGARERVVDMRGPQVREASSIAEALRQQEEEALANDPGKPLRPLQYNVQLLADMARASVELEERRNRAAENALEALRAQQESVQLALDAGATQIAHLEAFAAEVSKACRVASRTVCDAAAAFAELRKSFPAEWIGYRLDTLALGVVVPQMERALVSWDPLSQPDLHVEEFCQWRKVLQSSREEEDEEEENEEEDKMDVDEEHSKPIESAVYLRMLMDVFLPHVRRATLAWKPRDAAPMADFLIKWAPALPEKIRNNVLGQLVLPRLQAEVEAWNPRIDPLPVHTWLHPWLPIVPDQRLLEPIFSLVRSKLASAFNAAWKPGDPSGHAMLLPWKAVWDAASMESLLARAVLPKLTSVLHASAVSRKDQAPDALQWLFSWVDLLSERSIVALLEAEFFPKWTRVLAEWLSDSDADYSEISQWYIRWKGMFPAQLLSNPRIQAHLAYALDLMNSAISGEPAPPPPILPPIVPPPPPSSSQQRAQRRTTPADEDEPLELRDVIENLATRSGVLFAPTARERDGCPIFKFGERSIVVSAKVVYAFDSLTAAWRPVSLQELVESATQKPAEDPH